jgi:hypothetical protein
VQDASSLLLTEVQIGCNDCIWNCFGPTRVLILEDSSYCRWMHKEVVMHLRPFEVLCSALEDLVPPREAPVEKEASIRHL